MDGLDAAVGVDAFAAWLVRDGQPESSSRNCSCQ